MKNAATSYVYAGNRGPVLWRMLDLNLKIEHILPAKGSRLEQEVLALGIPVSTIDSKQQAIDILLSLKFDVFVSAGFPFILPITSLRRQHPDAIFVNIHPSFLPDLRGADPIPGAVLFRRDSGVTCHLMDDGIDTGPVICQRPIRYFDELDSKLLYRLCFDMEPTVFEEALNANFVPSSQLSTVPNNLIYYSFKSGDAQFHPEDDDMNLLSRLRAFNTPRKGYQFCVNGKSYRAFKGTRITEKTIIDLFPSAQYNEIVSVFEDSILVMRNRSIIRLSYIAPYPTSEMVGFKLSV